MIPLHRWPALVSGLGLATMAMALAWWGVTFWPPVSNDYLSVAEAGRCLVADSSLCDLATSLCGARHAAVVSAYSPVALWLGTTVAFCGLWPTSDDSRTSPSEPSRDQASQ